MTETDIKISGMSCQHCVMNIKKAIDAVRGIQSSEVTVGSARVLFDETETDKDAILKAVQNAGYTVSD